MDILVRRVENETPAVREFPADGDALLAEQMHQHIFSQISQIPGDDQIKILRTGMGIVKMRQYGVKCSRG